MLRLNPFFIITILLLAVPAHAAQTQTKLDINSNLEFDVVDPSNPFFQQTFKMNSDGSILLPPVTPDADYPKCKPEQKRSIRWNNNSNAFEGCDGSWWINFAHYPPINCRITSFHVGEDETAEHTAYFTAADCGGRLPDSNYFGVLAQTEVCGEDESWAALQPSYGQSPGVWFWTKGNCGNPGGSNVALIEVVYIHK